MSPEVARGEEYNAKADVYSFGLLVYECLSLRRPYENIPPSMLESSVFYQGTRPKCPKCWPRPVKSLVTRCWSEEVQHRPTITQVLLELRRTIDLMCPTSELRQRRPQRSIDFPGKERPREGRLSEDSQTQRSESTFGILQQ